MRVLAVVRQVLDAEETVHIRDGRVDLSSSKLVLDTMDEYGVEQALQLRESGAVSEVIVLAVGPDRIQDALRTALAMGADRAIHVLAPDLPDSLGPLDPLALSKVVAQVALEEKVELILTGGQQADWDSHALGAATAERLGWPQATWAHKLEIDGNSATGTHDVDSGSVSFRVALPLVVTTQQGLNEPRYPTVPNIMKAKKKEIRQERLERFQAASKVELISSEIQVRQRMKKILDGKDVAVAASQFVEFLRNEARVIP
jgi:electron transfer flavoprotein beta subunit